MWFSGKNHGKLYRANGCLYRNAQKTFSGFPLNISAYFVCTDENVAEKKNARLCVSIDYVTLIKKGHLPKPGKSLDQPWDQNISRAMFMETLG